MPRFVWTTYRDDRGTLRELYPGENEEGEKEFGSYWEAELHFRTEFLAGLQAEMYKATYSPRREERIGSRQKMRQYLGFLDSLEGA